MAICSLPKIVFAMTVMCCAAPSFSQQSNTQDSPPQFSENSELLTPPSTGTAKRVGGTTLIVTGSVVGGIIAAMGLLVIAEYDPLFGLGVMAAGGGMIAGSIVGGIALRRAGNREYIRYQEWQRQNPSQNSAARFSGFNLFPLKNGAGVAFNFEIE